MQPDCDLLPIKGMFVSQLKPPRVLLRPASLLLKWNQMLLLFLNTPGKYLLFRLDAFRSGHSCLSDRLFGGYSDTQRRQCVTTIISCETTQTWVRRWCKCLSWGCGLKSCAVPFALIGSCSCAKATAPGGHAHRPAHGTGSASGIEKRWENGFMLAQNQTVAIY